MQKLVNQQASSATNSNNNSSDCTLHLNCCVVSVFLSSVCLSACPSTTISCVSRYLFIFCTFLLSSFCVSLAASVCLSVGLPICMSLTPWSICGRKSEPKPHSCRHLFVGNFSCLTKFSMKKMPPTFNYFKIPSNLHAWYLPVTGCFNRDKKKAYESTSARGRCWRKKAFKNKS